jgi:hypothetical protein
MKKKPKPPKKKKSPKKKTPMKKNSRKLQVIHHLWLLGA